MSSCVKFDLNIFKRLQDVFLNRRNCQQLTVTERSASLNAERIRNDLNEDFLHT